MVKQITKTLDERKLTVREGEGLTGIAAANFSRIRRANLGRFTIDRLMTILNQLNRQVEVTVVVRLFPNAKRLSPMPKRPAEAEVRPEGARTATCQPASNTCCAPRPSARQNRQWPGQ